MGVYLYPSGTETELKNAFIGGYYEYSYDFRNKSSTILTNDGWTVGSGYTYDANGIGNSSSWRATGINIPVDISNAKKLTITAGLYDANSMNCSIGTANGPTTGGVGASLIYSGRTSDGRVTIQLAGTEIAWYTGISNPSGQTSWTYTLDLENLTYNFVYNSINKSGTMTQTDVDNMHTYAKALRIFAQYGTGRVQYIDLKVDY